uniref:Zinc finger BED domain-containing protein 4 n=1 Tax=Bactrocera latifrons TaxID=174628 RepID=A0A0K8VVU5_BACLA
MPLPKNELLRQMLGKNELNQVICNYGACKKRVLSGHAANIQRHLRLMHPVIYNSYIEQKNASKCNGNITKSAETRHEMRQKCSRKKSKIELAIVEFFTKCERPLGMLEDRAFKVLAEPAFATLNMSVNRNSVLEMISSYAHKLRAEIRDDLSGSLFSLKIDMATKEDITLLGINVQYIKERSIQIKSLAIKELQRGYTSEYVKTLIMEVLNEYSINIQEILAITSNDNTILDAVKELNEDLHNVLGGDETFNHKTIKKESGFDSSFEEWLEETDLTSYNITSVLSGTQTIQLCVDAILQNPEIEKNLDKCGTLMKELGTPDVSQIFGPASYENKRNDCTTMYEFLEKLPDMLPTNATLYLNTDEWSFVKELLAVLKPLYNATKKLQKEQLCYSELYTVIMNIVFELENLHNNKMAKSLIDALNMQKTKLLEMEIFNTAVFLDPRIRVCLDATQKSRAKQYITTLYNRVSTLKGDTTISETNDSVMTEMPSTAEERPLSSHNAKSFVEFLQNLDTEPSSAPVSYLDAEITLYERQPRLPLDANIIDFWFYQHNTLMDMAYLILAIPCSEVSTERLSAAFQYIFADKQNPLSAANIDNILVVKVNGVFNYDN